MFNDGFKLVRTIKFIRNRRENWQLREYVDAIQLQHYSTVRRINSIGSKRTIQTILILSYQPDYRPMNRIHETNTFTADEDQGNLFGAIRNAVLVLTRIFVIGSVAIGLAAAYFVTRFTCGHVFPTILLKSIEFLGPIFIKFGQWVSTRKDLFPEDICCTLSRLQRIASTHSWFYTKQLLKSIYGSNWRKIFVKFDNKETPIGSGCCAQVYKAWVDLNVEVEATQNPRIPTFVQIVEYLRLGSLITSIDRLINYRGKAEILEDDSQCAKLKPVAIKILHPGIKDQLRRDLFIMRCVSKCVTYVIPELYWLSLTDCVDEFSRIMENQVDMNREAKNLMKFSNNFSGRKDVIFPKPYVNFTQREILVESFHEASTILDFFEYKDNKLQKKLAKIGIKMMSKMVFQDNFIHCDLHPGNILVELNHEPIGGIGAWLWSFIDRDHPRLIILDCGLVVSLDNRCHQNLKDVLRSVLMGNGELAAEYILEHSSHTCPDPDGFKNTLRDILDDHMFNRTAMDVTMIMSELFSAMVRHKVKQDGSFSNVILSMAMIEGLGRNLYPDINIIAEVFPFLFI